MKIKLIILLIITILFSSCKTNQIQNGLKHGKWITYDTIENDIYKYVEYFYEGNEYKTWKTFKNKKLFKKIVNLKNKSLITYYDKNRTIIESGQTFCEENEKERHWFYDGEWKFFDSKGKLIKIKYYYRGVLISEKNIK